MAVKEASGNISQVAKIMNLTDGKIDLYSGNDDQIVPIMSLGGIGVISTAQIGYREPDFDLHPIEANLRAIGDEIRKAKEKAKGGCPLTMKIRLTKP